MASPARESHRDSRISAGHGVRGRSYEVLLNCFADAVGADAAILLGRREDERPGIQMVANWSREGREPELSFTSRSLVGRAFAGEDMLVEPSTNGDGGGHRAVAAPVSSHERVIGAIYAGFDPPATATRDELVWAADAYAQLAALCMDPDGTLAAVLGSARFDALTGCLSYAGTVDALTAEMQRSGRHRHDLCCCMIDLDAFKAVNDVHGHMEGDRVLAAVGAALRSAARTYDAVGRFGGDEFVIVLPETNSHGGRRVGERFLAAVKSAIAETTTESVGASVGIAAWDGASSAEQLLDHADLMMRDAKARGGARVRSEPLTAGGLDGLAELAQQLAQGLAPGREA